MLDINEAKRTIGAEKMCHGPIWESHCVKRHGSSLSLFFSSSVVVMAYAKVNQGHDMRMLSEKPEKLQDAENE